MIEITSSVRLTGWDVVNALGWSTEGILDFILEVDAEVGAWDFTVALRDKLTELINENEAEIDG